LDNPEIRRVPLLCHNPWQSVATSDKKIFKVLQKKGLWRVRGGLEPSLFRGMKTNKTENSRTQDWLTPSEVCSRLSISYDTWAKWRLRGIAPRVTRLPNGQLRTREDWLADFMDDLAEAS
jgi:hypothetical protein